MEQKFNFGEQRPEVTRALGELGQIAEKSLGSSLFSLIHNRTSQINGCAFCLDLDVKKARMRGERELRLYHIAVWRESNLFTDKERAALEFAEAVTKITPEGVPNDVLKRVREHFSDKEIADLTFAISLVNVWNRMNVVFHTPP